VLALGAAGAHERAARVAHDRLHVGEVDVDHAVVRDEVADALDGLESTSSAAGTRRASRGPVVAERSSFWFGIVMMLSTE
jgi:hypothetical protein